MRLFENLVCLAKTGKWDDCFHHRNFSKMHALYSVLVNLRVKLAGILTIHIF
jgi:hypothetical protein